MPYIKQEDRNKFKDVLNLLENNNFPKNAGELNYFITKVLLTYYKNSYKNYQSFNDMIGALEGAKLELYRRYVSPYEDIEIKENGDL